MVREVLFLLPEGGTASCFAGGPVEPPILVISERNAASENPTTNANAAAPVGPPATFTMPASLTVNTSSPAARSYERLAEKEGLELTNLGAQPELVSKTEQAPEARARGTSSSGKKEIPSITPRSAERNREKGSRDHEDG